MRAIVAVTKRRVVYALVIVFIVLLVLSLVLPNVGGGSHGVTTLP